MFQIVLTSEFIRDLKQSTSGGSPRVEVPREPIVQPEEISELPRARTGLAALGEAIFGAANRLLGAH